MSKVVEYLTKIIKKALSQNKCNNKNIVYSMAMIEPIRSCPVKCVPCPIGRESIRKHPSITLDLQMANLIFERLRNQFKTSRIVFGNWGEPLLHPKFPDLVAIAKSYHFEEIYLTTSLSVNKSMKDLILSGIDTIHVSISGITEDIYNKSHKHGDLPLVLKNLEELAYLRSSLKKFPNIAVRWHRYHYNEFQLNVAQNYCNNLGIEFLPYFGHPGGYEALRDWQTNNLEEPLKGFVESSIFSDFIKEACLLNTVNVRCPQEEFLVIDADGSLLLCCSSYTNHKNVKPFLSLSNKEIFEFKKADLPSCKQCLDLGWAGYLIRPKTAEEYDNKISFNK